MHDTSSHNLIKSLLFQTPEKKPAIVTFNNHQNKWVYWSLDQLLQINMLCRMETDCQEKIIPEFWDSNRNKV